MMRFFIPLFVFFCNLAYSQDTLTCFIYDKRFDVPIEFANIVFDKTNGSVTDSAGKFLISHEYISQIKYDTIIISHISYQTLKIPLNKISLFLKDGNIIFLEPKEYRLSEIIINPKNNSTKRIGGESRSIKNFGGIGGNGAELLTKISLSHSPAKLLDLRVNLIEVFLIAS